MALSLTLDHAQNRILRRRVAVLAQGGWPGDGGETAPGWEQESSTAWVEPYGLTALNWPFCFDAAWEESRAGDYVKFAAADLLRSDAANWSEFDLSPGIRALVYDGSSYPASLVREDWEPGRGIVLRYFSYGPPGGAARDRLDLTMIWSGDLGSGSLRTEIEFYSSGLVLVRDEARSRIGSVNLTPGDAPGGVDGRYVEVLVQPVSPGTWLIHSTAGGGGRVADARYQDSPPAPMTAGDMTLRWDSMRPCAMAAEARYLSPCTVDSVVSGLAEDVTGRAATWTTWSGSYDPGATISAAWRGVSGGGAWSLGTDGLRGRIRTTTTCDGFRPVSVAAAMIEWAATSGSTPDETYEIGDEESVRIAIDAPEDPSGTTLSVTIREPDGVPRIKEVANRPLRLTLGDVYVFGGRTDPPAWEEGAYAESERLEITARDAWKVCERTRSRDPLPLDDLTIRQACLALLAVIAWPASATDVEDDPYVLPRGAMPSRGDWANLLEPSDTVADGLRRLFETYAGNWDYGFRPGVAGMEFFAHSPDARPVRDVTLYDTLEGADGDRARVMRRQRPRRLAPECNEVRLTGWDPVERRPFAVFCRDDAAADPGIPLASRRGNWDGEPVEVAYVEPGIQSEAAAERAVALLADRLMRAPLMVEWESELLMIEGERIVWRGDEIDLDGVGPVRIVSGPSGEIVRWAEGGAMTRTEMTYVGEVLE